MIANRNSIRSTGKKAAMAALFLGPLAALAQEGETTSFMMSDSTKLWLLSGMLVFQIVLLFTISGIIKNLTGSKGLWSKFLKSKAAATGTAVVTLLVITVPAYAQDGASQAFVLDASLENLLLSLNAFLLISIIVLLGTLRKLVRVLTEAEKTEAELAIQSVGWWSKFMTRVTDAVPVDDEGDIIMSDHDYDGIKELDNNLPPWWVAGFYITIVMAGVYLFYYHIYGDGNIMENEYRAEMEAAAKEKEAYLASLANSVDENTVTILMAESELQKGKVTYEANCVACHASSGGGGVGPNLTDEYWLHGGGIKEVFTTIKYGISGTAMIAWGEQLSPPQLQQVASYIMSLQGTQPADGIPPQGEVWEDASADADGEEEVPEEMPADSVTTSEAVDLATL